MSRVSIIEQLCSKKKKDALYFNYDSLKAPPLYSLLTFNDVMELNRIATSAKLNGNINKKYKLIDAILKPRNFKRGNCGTNRVVYNYLEDDRFCLKIALDKAGLKDSPAEFKNQEYFKPFCCKIFEVDPTGTVAVIERVNPISSAIEFLSVADDIYNLMTKKIIGKYVVDDLGSEYYMNYGIRYDSYGVSFGPVIIDFPYAYELDGNKLLCGKEIINPDGTKTICKGEIDYDDHLSHLVCTKCGKKYTARELAKDETIVLKLYTGESNFKCRSRILSGDKLLFDSGRSSNLLLSEKEYEEVKMNSFNNRTGDVPVKKTIRKKRTIRSINDCKREIEKSLRDQYIEDYIEELNNKEVSKNETPVFKTIKDLPSDREEIYREEPMTTKTRKVIKEIYKGEVVYELEKEDKMYKSYKEVIPDISPEDEKINLIIDLWEKLGIEIDDDSLKTNTVKILDFETLDDDDDNIYELYIINDRFAIREKVYHHGCYVKSDCTEGISQLNVVLDTINKYESEKKFSGIEHIVRCIDPNKFYKINCLIDTDEEAESEEKDDTCGTEETSEMLLTLDVIDLDKIEGDAFPEINANNNIDNNDDEESDEYPYESDDEYEDNDDYSEYLSANKTHKYDKREKNKYDQSLMDY